jgi:hypothetical protein
VHAVLLTHGKPCPVSDLFGVRGRQRLARLNLPQPWQATIEASLRLIDELDREIGDRERELRRLGADHPYVPLLLTAPGISWVLAYTIAAEIGDIHRFPTPRKLAGHSGLCPRVYQSGERDLRGPLSKQGPRYLRWALVEAATHACTAAVYHDRYQQTKARIGKQRGAKIAQIDLARRLTEAIWHTLTRNGSGRLAATFALTAPTMHPLMPRRSHAGPHGPGPAAPERVCSRCGRGRWFRTVEARPSRQSLSLGRCRPGLTKFLSVESVGILEFRLRRREPQRASRADSALSFSLKIELDNCRFLPPAAGVPSDPSP